MPQYTGLSIMSFVFVSTYIHYVCSETSEMGYLGSKMGSFWRSQFVTGPQNRVLIYLRARVKKKTSKMELFVKPINPLETDISPKSRISRVCTKIPHFGPFWASQPLKTPKSGSKSVQNPDFRAPKHPNSRYDLGMKTVAHSFCKQQSADRRV